MHGHGKSLLPLLAFVGITGCVHLWSHVEPFSETLHRAGTSVDSVCFLSIPVNSDYVLQWWSMTKYILKHTQMTYTFHTKIIFHNYILY